MGLRAPFPRCLHKISCAHLPPPEDDDHRRRRRSSKPKIRLVIADAGVRIYDRPVKASDLMHEFPKHMVCRSDCFYIGQKTPPLAGGARLQPGHNYFLLPADFFQSALSFATFLRCRTALAGRPPFEVEMTPSGDLRVKITEEMIAERIEEEGEKEKVEGVCTTPQLRRDYEQLVGRRRSWKPKLDTIAERKKREEKMNKFRKTKSSLV